MASKAQVIFIGGGDAFRDSEQLYAMLRSRDFDLYADKKYWRDTVAQSLIDTHECHTIKMPNPNWADYTAWSIWFEKVMPFLRGDVVLVGHSLGGGFLLRYLTDNQLPVTIGQLHLVSPVVCANDLTDTDGFAVDCQSWNGFASTIDKLHLWHSEDDTIVPIHHSERLAELYPKAQLHRFADRFHFIGSEFPELLAEIQK